MMRALCNAKRHSASLVALCYFLIATLLTWPLAFHLNSLLFGDYGDTRGSVWGIWSKVNGLLDGTINHWVSAPYGVIADRGFSPPLTDWLNNVFAQYSNELVAYNLFALIAFPLTAFSTYFLLNKLLNNKIAAFVGGLIFGFCPGAVMQAAGGHTSYAFNAFIPLFLGALFYNRAHRTILSAFYISASFSLIVFIALYFGYFAIYIAIFFIVFDLINEKRMSRVTIFVNYLWAGLFAVILILPFEYKAIYQQIKLSSTALTNSGLIRNIDQLQALSSRPWDFLLPSVDHPILGKYVYDFVRAHLHWSNIPEQTLYLGLVPLGLLLTGFVLLSRSKFKDINQSYFVFFSLGALWMYFLSLPPLISIGNVTVPTVSYFAHSVAPMFRVYARFGILVNFFVACAVAVVLTHLYGSMKRASYYLLLAGLLPLLVFEYWSIPPGYALSVDKPPQVYLWLAKESKEAIVAEYPMTPGTDCAFYTYLFWQRIHHKKLVNGATPENIPAWELYEQIKDLNNPTTPALLKTAGVSFVIVHSDMYREGLIPDPLKRYFPEAVSSITYNEGKMPAAPYPLKLVKSFGSDFVFAWEKDNK